MFLAYFWKINNSYKTPKNKPSVEITDIGILLNS